MKKEHQKLIEILLTKDESQIRKEIEAMQIMNRFKQANKK